MTERHTHHEHDNNNRNVRQILPMVSHADSRLVAVTMPDVQEGRASRSTIDHIADLVKREEQLEAELDTAVEAVVDACTQRDHYRTLAATFVQTVVDLKRRIELQRASIAHLRQQIADLMATHRQEAP